MSWLCQDRVVIDGLVTNSEFNGSPGTIEKYSQNKDRYKVMHARGCHWVKPQNLLTALQFAMNRIERAPNKFRCAKRYAVTGPKGQITFVGPVMMVELRLRRRYALQNACEKIEGIPTKDMLLQLRKAFNYTLSKTPVDNVEFWESKKDPSVPDGCASYYHTAFDCLTESEKNKLMSILRDTYHFSYPAALLYARLHPEYKPVCGCLYLGNGPTGRPDLEFRSISWAIQETPSYRHMRYDEMLPEIGDQVIINPECATWLEEELFHLTGTIIAQNDGASQVAFVADAACGQTVRIIHLPTYYFTRDTTAARSLNGLMALTKTLLGALHASLDLLPSGSLAHTKRKQALEAVDDAVMVAMNCPHGCCYVRACKNVNTNLLKPMSDVAPPYSP